MDKKYLLPLVILLCAITIVITYCAKNNETTVSTQILYQDSINEVYIFQEQQGSPVGKITDSSIIQEYLKQINEISIYKLTKDEEKQFVQNGKLSEKGLLQTVLSISEKTVGQLMIWSDGTIYVLDVQTLNSSKRTVSYLSKEQHPGIYQWLLNKI